MVNPVLIIGITLIGAFFIGVARLWGDKFAKGVFWIIMLFDLIGIGSILWGFLKGTITEPIIVKIGGFAPPIGINLYVDIYGSFVAFLIFFIGAVSIWHWFKMGMKEPQAKTITLFLLILMGGTGMVFTQDFFNLFVFIEITSIAAYGLVASKMDGHSLEAAFKYIVVGSISSIFVLLGAVLLYKYTGSLNMADIAMKIKPEMYSGGFMLVAIMFLFGLLIELEVFPMNGWALDIYQSANPAVVAILAGGIAKGFYLVFLRTFRYLHFPYILEFALLFGLTTYIISQFFALKQSNIRRLFGYSSVGQLGLLILAGGFYLSGKLTSTGEKYTLMAIMFFILNHTFSKSTLFFLADSSNLIDIEDIRGKAKNSRIFRFLFSSSVFSMAGAPPFAGFWAKLFLILAIPHEYFYVIAIILIGAIAELIYYLKLFRFSMEENGSDKVECYGMSTIINVLILFVIAMLGGYKFMEYTGIVINKTIPILFGISAVMYIFGFSRTLQWILSVIAVVFAMFRLDINITTLPGFFAYLILAGGAIMLFATYPLSKKYRPSFYSFVLVTLFSMVGIVLADNWVTLFIFWEMMSWSSYLVIGQGEKAGKAAWVYMIMSAIGGYFMLAGINLLSANSNLVPYYNAVPLNGTLWAAVLIFGAFLIKMATAPFHIWAKDAYGESPDGFTPILSGILSKMGVFGGIITVVLLIPHVKSSDVILYGLGWLGALTAFFMTLLAIFQEDAKKVLAYSSVGQVGYILIGISLATALGYSAALYHTINHFIFKGALFIGLAGIAYRTGTTYLPDLGGLIKRMPFTFFAFLVSIIALAGIPPLSGFGGKWLLYTALLEKHWMFILVVAMLASTAAFLYSYKLLHAIFLGQLKDEHKNIKEAPMPILLGQLFLAIMTMVFGARPDFLLNITEKVLVTSLNMPFPGYSHEGAYRIVSTIGYWNAWFMMIFVMGSFAIALIIFWINNPKIRWVGQLDIGYSGEVPESPESVHFGYEMYMHFRRAVGFLVKPVVDGFYKVFYASILSIVDYMRRIYTGDVNTYAMWVLVSLTIILAVFVKGVF